MELFFLGAAFLIPLEPTDSTGKMVNMQQFKDVRNSLLLVKILLKEFPVLIFSIYVYDTCISEFSSF